MRGEKEKQSQKERAETGKRTALSHSTLTGIHVCVLLGQAFTVVRAIWLSNQTQTCIVWGLERRSLLTHRFKGPMPYFIPCAVRV